MPDVTREDFPEANEKERKRADIGDHFNAEVDESERGQNFQPRRGEDVRDNVPGRYAAQGGSRWGRGEPGERDVRRAAEEERRKATEGRATAGEERESAPFADTAFEARAQRAQAGEEGEASVDEASKESRRASHGRELRKGSPGAKAHRRMPGNNERE